MPNTQLSTINIFPVKSMANVSLSSAFVGESGLAFDRRFMLSTPTGELLSARNVPELLHYQALIKADGLEIISPKGDHITLRYPELFQNYRQVTLWGTDVNAQHCGTQFDEWFTERLGVPCQLLYFGEQSERYTSRRPEKPVAFADGYPLLLISEASLADLNSRSAAPSVMDQFRANLVVSNCEAFAEDGWKRIRIGEVEFEIVKPCSRCIMTSYDLNSLKPISKGEPIKTLSKYRLGEDNEIYFGQNLIPLNEGQIALNDTVEVLETKAPEQYPDNAPVINNAVTNAASTNTAPRLTTSQTTWDNDQTLNLTCVARVEETSDVVTFRFQLPQGYRADYLAGQFITLNLTIDGLPIARCYTLSSSPSRPSDIAITVKRVSGGCVSNWLHDNLNVGDHITALPPQGVFNKSVLPTNAPCLLLSAGSGITPMLSIVRALTDTHAAQDIIFYHQARTEADLICQDELRWLAQQNPQLKLLFCLSQPDPTWSGLSGRINLTQLQQQVPDLKARTVLCCGPEGFMTQAKTLCQQLGHQEENWHEESFGLPPHSTILSSLTEIELTINGSTIAGDNQTTLLDQAEDAGIYIPSGCRAGVCGACKVTLIKGEVEQSSDLPLSDKDKQQGAILACSSIPESDCEIEF
ncbi:MOSC N-terminal beta barrel domain-containing protein [Neptuniibacter pectenicola]|uniref:MOSC N-terminal beta barrel domain-containing protein n=1 Tax=Neptuniibacter pectenicola TaxID=1806669 RepID=UPI003EE9BAE7